MLCGEVVVGLLDRDLRQGDAPAVLGRLDLRLRLAQLRFEGGGVHPGDDLAGLDRVALIEQDVLDAAGIFGGDVDLVGFQPAVAGGEAGGKRRLRKEVPGDAAADHQRGADEIQRGFRLLAARPFRPFACPTAFAWPDGAKA